jgi:hypothetical protein
MLMVQINNVIIIMLRIELITNVKLEHKIDFKWFFLSKTACANTNLLEFQKIDFDLRLIFTFQTFVVFKV